MIVARLLLAAAALAWFEAACAVDSVSFEAGHGSDDTRVLRIAAQWKWDKSWSAGRSWRLGAYWEASAAHWENGRSINDFGLTPVFRLEPVDPGPWAPYIEGAVGFHLLTDLRVSTSRLFSTRFQYGDHLGAGVRFGEKQRYDLGVRLQHISNGGLRHPNPGINFILFRLQVGLD